jgi:hypothetical protein
MGTPAGWRRRAPVSGGARRDVGARRQARQRRQPSRVAENCPPDLPTWQALRQVVTPPCAPSRESRRMRRPVPRLRVPGLSSILRAGIRLLPHSCRVQGDVPFSCATSSPAPAAVHRSRGGRGGRRGWSRGGGDLHVSPQMARILGIDQCRVLPRFAACPGAYPGASCPGAAVCAAKSLRLPTLSLHSCRLRLGHTTVHLRNNFRCFGLSQGSL